MRVLATVGLIAFRLATLALFICEICIVHAVISQYHVVVPPTDNQLYGDARHE